MADIKDMFNGAFSKVMEMAQTSGVADKVRDIAETSGVKDAYVQGAERMKAYGDLAKLTMSLNGDSSELRRVYAEIGRLYFEENRMNPEGFYAPLFSQAEELSEKIRAAQAEIDECREKYRSRKEEKDIEVEIAEFEEIVDSSAEPENTDDIEVEIGEFDKIVDQTAADAIIYNTDSQE